LERGVEVVESACPVLLTVHSSAPDCRVRNAKRMMKYKHAKTAIELQELSEDYLELFESRPYLKINQWSVDDLNADVSLLGLGGSPTKVKKIESVVFTQKESKTLSDSDRDINKLMKTLINSHVLG
jgi:electron transfer flavoprotein beta subunit